MKKNKIYISGQITGLTPAEYIHLFTKVEAKLKGKGYDVVTPLAIKIDAPIGATEAELWRAHLKADIRELTKCEAIYMLSNWEHSEGATLEHAIAKGLRLRIEYEVEPQHREIKEAIEAVMGVPFRFIATDSRRHWHVYARMIYAHHAKKDGDHTQKIASEVNHDESSICYYLRHYDSEYKYNREFRKVAEKVATLLSRKLKPTQE